MSEIGNVTRAAIYRPGIYEGNLLVTEKLRDGDEVPCQRDSNPGPIEFMVSSYQPPQLLEMSPKDSTIDG